MIVSHRHRFVFAAVPKTGTHAVRQALRPHLGPDDVEQVKLFVEKQLPYPEIAKIGHGHISFAQIRPALGDALFGSYVKFAFVRNPFERFVSYCAFVTRDTEAFARDPQRIMRQFLFVTPPRRHMVFWPQHHFLTDERGDPLWDELGRVEEMQADYDRIAARIGLPSTPLERVNGSQHGDYRSYYTQELIDGVATLYARDLMLFDYQF